MKYVCTVCGYIYDDAEQAIPFEELPDSWTCPLCGAPKALFEKVDEPTEEKTEEKTEESKEIPEKAEEKSVAFEDEEELMLLGAGELSALFSNLARGCEKQYQEEAKNCFKEIADYFENRVKPTENPTVEYLAELVKEDLDRNYKSLIEEAKSAGDRGTLRITTWGEKVTRIAKSLVDRYIREGDSFLANTGLYICTVCGFLYVGDNPPEICPVCKVPSWKFEKVDGRASK